MEFKQLATGTPPDIEATMTLAQAEEFRSDLEECEGGESDSFMIVNDAINNAEITAANITFIIPGSEAGEDGDLIPELEEFLEGINDKLIEESEL